MRHGSDVYPGGLGMRSGKEPRNVSKNLFYHVGQQDDNCLGNPRSTVLRGHIDIIIHRHLDPLILRPLSTLSRCQDEDLDFMYVGVSGVAGEYRIYAKCIQYSYLLRISMNLSRK